MTADADGGQARGCTGPGPDSRRLPGPRPFVGSRKAPRALADAVPRLCLPVRGGEAPFRRDASHCALSRFLPTYTFQMLFVLPASHGLRPSDKLVLWTYVVAIMGVLTSRSLPAAARQLAPRPGPWRARSQPQRTRAPRAARSGAAHPDPCTCCPAACDACLAASSWPHFTGEETEAQGGKLEGPTSRHRSRSQRSNLAWKVPLQERVLSIPTTLPQRRDPKGDMPSASKRGPHLQEGAYASGLFRKAGKGTGEGSYGQRNSPNSRLRGISNNFTTYRLRDRG